MLTLVRVWTSLLLTMNRPVSIVHYITDNVDETCFVYIQRKIRINFLLRCNTKVSCLSEKIEDNFSKQDFTVICNFQTVV